MTALTSGVISQAYAGPVQAFVLSKIAKLYPPSVLFPNLPPVLHAVATRETIYRVSLSRLVSTFPSAQAGKLSLQVLHDEDMKLLDSIAAGDMPLLNSSDAVIDPSLGAVEIFSTTMDYLPTFHEGARLDQVQDEVKLQALIDERLDRGL